MAWSKICAARVMQIRDIGPFPSAESNRSALSARSFPLVGVGQVLRASDFQLRAARPLRSSEWRLIVFCLNAFKILKIFPPGKGKVYIYIEIKRYISVMCGFYPYLHVPPKPLLSGHSRGSGSRKGTHNIQSTNAQRSWTACRLAT